MLKINTVEISNKSVRSFSKSIILKPITVECCSLMKPCHCCSQGWAHFPIQWISLEWSFEKFSETVCILLKVMEGEILLSLHNVVKRDICPSVYFTYYIMMLFYTYKFYILLYVVIFHIKWIFTLYNHLLTPHIIS